jgi:hypothetical protein
VPNNSSVTVGSAPKGITTTTKELRERENNTHTHKKKQIFLMDELLVYICEESRGKKITHTN